MVEQGGNQFDFRIVSGQLSGPGGAAPNQVVDKNQAVTVGDWSDLVHAVGIERGKGNFRAILVSACLPGATDIGVDQYLFAAAIRRTFRDGDQRLGLL